MANLVKKELDTRTFPQIYATISSAEWIAIRDEIIEKTEKTIQAVHKWKDGKCIPMSPTERRVVASIVGRLLKIKTDHRILFPIQ